MYAIVRTGGKQYRVQPGDIIRVEKLEQALGSEFDITDVLMVGGETPTVGTPTVSNAKVTVVVTKQTRDRKVIIFKKKRRQGYRRFKTHRQPFTELFVKAISMNGKVTKTDETANVVDVDQQRQDKIQARSERQAAPSDLAEAVAKAKPAKKAAPKKKTAKKPAAKKAKKTAAKKTKKTK